METSANKPGGKPPKDQYHHVIPRFILREFQIGPRKSRRERNLDYRKFGFVDEKVWFYDTQKHTLDQRLISGVYGVNNLYRDVSSQDVDELEKKLSSLENTAARILRDIHDTLDKPLQGSRSPTFTIIRSDYEQLRKFLFVMHYRNEGLSRHYFNPDHPENAAARYKLKSMQDKLNGKTPSEMWLHFLRYFLDTPHSQIDLDAIEGMQTNEPGEEDYRAHFLNSIFNPNMENGCAVTYHTHMWSQYLSIVQAAPGEEFVLGHNTFGLWEGTTAGRPFIHDLYVISPRIAILLRKNSHRPEDLRPELLAVCRSNFLEIRLPVAVWTSSTQVPEMTTVREMLTYVGSSETKNDRCCFPITKLTKRQTYHINSTVMVNVRPQGSLTFLSPQAMRATVRALWRDREFRARLERYRYVPLICQLTSSSLAMTRAGESIKPATNVIRLRAPPKRSENERAPSHTAPAPPHDESMADEMEFPSSVIPPSLLFNRRNDNAVKRAILDELLRRGFSPKFGLDSVMKDSKS